MYSTNLFTKSNNLIYKIVGRFVIWETAHNGYLVTDRKQRFVLAYGLLDDCIYFVNMHPYGMKLDEMKANCIAEI